MTNANQKDRQSWIEIPHDSDFPIQNIPFGIVQYGDYYPHPASRIGDYAIDISILAEHGFFDFLQLDDLTPFFEPYLNPLIELGKDVTSKIRNRIAELCDIQCEDLQANQNLINEVFIPIDHITNYMPVYVTDYTDFYSSIEHATNVGIMFRSKENALMPNWKHLPVGYHGRSSSIVVSDTNIYRPKGQILPSNEEMPVFGASRRLDFELEMAFIVGKDTELGESVSVDNAEEYIFGFLLFNDLSARDIQKWEYQPLGPFLSKSFGSVVSPWIVTIEALEPFRVSQPQQDPVLPYLQSNGKHNFDINLEVYLQPDGNDASKICQSNFKYMYWSINQQLAHQTINGCNINVGDLYASGTISGSTKDSYGSLLELSWNGTEPITLDDGSQRTFIEDNDTITIKGFAEKNGIRIGFGGCSTKILPAISD